MEAKEPNTIAPLGSSIVRGRFTLGVGDLVIGSRLARELGVDVGDSVILRGLGLPRGETGVAAPESILVVRGIFTLGVQAIDERVVYIDLASARKLLDVVDGVSLIEIKVDDVWQAPLLAERLERATILKASNWLDRNTRRKNDCARKRVPPI